MTEPAGELLAGLLLAGKPYNNREEEGRLQMLPAVTTGRSIAKTLGRVKADTIQYYTRDEMNMILSDDLRSKDPDAYFFVLFLWRTGARISEALSVCVKDVDTTNKVIRIKTLKRRDGHIKTIPIHDDFLGHLFVYLNRKKLTYEDKLFPFTRKTGWTWAVSACEAAGYTGERAHPHTFRHSFAIHMLANGVPITAVQEMLGHAELANTWVYTKILGLDTRRYVDNVKF